MKKIIYTLMVTITMSYTPAQADLAQYEIVQPNGETIKEMLVEGEESFYSQYVIYDDPTGKKTNICEQGCTFRKVTNNYQYNIIQNTDLVLPPVIETKTVVSQSATVQPTNQIVNEQVTETVTVVQNSTTETSTTTIDTTTVTNAKQIFTINWEQFIAMFMKWFELYLNTLGIKINA